MTAIDGRLADMNLAVALFSAPFLGANTIGAPSRTAAGVAHRASPCTPATRALRCANRPAGGFTPLPHSPRGVLRATRSRALRSDGNAAGLARSWPSMVALSMS